MPKNYSRMQRIADLIQVTLAEIIQQEMKDGSFSMTTITAVKVSPDLSFAKIYVSVLDEKQAEEIITTLNKASKTIRYALAHAIDLRVTPKLQFFYDDSTVRGSHISSLINDVLKDKNSEHE